MSILVPDDAVRVLHNLINNSESVVNDAPLHRRLLLHGAIIDAKDLLAEIRGGERIDTHAAAISVPRDEAKKIK